MSLSPKCAIAFWSSELYYPVWTQALNIKSWNYFWVFKQQNWDHQAQSSGCDVRIQKYMENDDFSHCSQNHNRFVNSLEKSLVI